MNKYEIMSIVSPKADVKVLNDILTEVFDKGIVKVEKLERTELAYEINKSKQAQYVLALVETEGKNITEFIRRSNISKDIWRTLVINLDTEKGLNKKVSKTRRNNQQEGHKKSYSKKEFTNKVVRKAEKEVKPSTTEK